MFRTFFPVILIRVNERIFNLPASHGELCFGSSEVWVTSQSAANLPLLSERTCSSKTTSVRIRAHNKHGNHIGKIVLNSCSFLPAFEGSEVILTSSQFLSTLIIIIFSFLLFFVSVSVLSLYCLIILSFFSSLAIYLHFIILYGFCFSLKEEK